MRRVMGAVLMIAAAAIACETSYESVSSDAGPGEIPDAAVDAASDAGADAADAAPDSAFICNGVPHTFCDDFDRGASFDVTRWTFVDNPMNVSLVQDQVVSAPNALRVVTPAGTRVVLDKVLPLPKQKIVCSMQVRLAGQPGTSGARVASLVFDDATGTRTLMAFLFTDAFETGFFVTSADGGATYVPAYKDALAGQTANLVSLRIELRIVGDTLSAQTSLAGSSPSLTSTPMTGPLTSVRFRVGSLGAAADDGGTFDVRFDDVACDVE